MSTSFVSCSDPLCEKLANALGFTSGTSLKFELTNPHDPLVVSISKSVTADELGGFVEVLSRYKVTAVPVEAKPE